MSIKSIKVIDQALADGVGLKISATGGVRAFSCDREKLKHWLPILREHKAEVVSLLLPKAPALEHHPANDTITQCRQAVDSTTCRTCTHFNRVTYHHRLGHCGKGEPEAVAGLWDTDRRYCEQWQRMDGCVS